MFRIGKLLPVVIFGLLSLLILSPFLQSGYLLTLDMVFGPNTGFCNIFYGITPVHGHMWLVLLFEILGQVMPMWAVQKILIFLILFSAGISAYHLCPGNTAGKLFAGLLYMLNPFVFVRFLAGHFLLLLGYAILPFAVKAFIEFFDAPAKDTFIKAVLLLTLVSVFSAHMMALLFLLIWLMLAFKLISLRNNLKPARRLLFFFTGLMASFAGLNAYWLLPILTGSPSGIDNIGMLDVFAFVTQPALSFNTVFTVASMYGFWRGGYVYVKDLLPLWYTLFIFILFLAVHGSITYYRSGKGYMWVWFFAFTGVIAVVLATGISGPFHSIFNFLFEHVFLFRSFREPHKFVALLVLAYSYLGGLGVTSISSPINTTPPPSLKISPTGIKKAFSAFIIILALLTPVVYSYTMFNGFGGQLESTDYPEDWYTIRSTILDDTTDFNILFLPWHLYMDFNWIPTPQKRIGNPATVFFKDNAIHGDNMEVGNIYTSSASPRSKYIESLLSKRNNIHNLGELTTPLNVKYILLAKEVDYQEYEFLYHQDDLELLKDTDTIVLFKNNKWQGPIYGINNTDNLNNNTKPIDYQKISPIKYSTKNIDTNYILFAKAYSTQWKLNKETGFQNKAGTTIFNNTNTEKHTIYYSRFNTYLAGYIISILTLIGLLFTLRRF